MKKFFLFLVCAVAFVAMAHAQQWVGLTKNAPAEPEITVTRSNNQQVSFTVGVSGFYAESKPEGGTVYQRLSIPACGVTGATGEPEIPVISKSIAVPVCSNISYSVTVLASQTLQGYRVYPVPELQPDNAGMLQEVFVLNPSAYLQNGFMPSEGYHLAETGALREQHFVTLEINPIRFNPATGQLEVITEMEITLTFNNPVTAVNANTGIFNKITASTFINYEGNGISAMINDKAFEKPNFTRGNVEWKTLTDTAQACQIEADYLIITVPEFFTPNDPNSQLQRLAEHRAYYNGYDVAILNVENILSDALGFYYEGTPPHPNPNPPHQWDNHKLEQRLRTCIRRIYEGAHAQHIGDGHLGYVLLVGDYADSIGGIVGPRSHGVEDWDYMYEIYPSDYYYTCITKDANGKYDEFGDLAIGRFSVEDSMQLFNMVNKTINHETLYSEDKAWRKTAGFSNIWNYDYFNPIYFNFVSNLLTNCGWNYTIVNGSSGHSPGYLRIPTMNYFNAGAAFVQYLSFGESYDTWSDGLDIAYFSNELHNDYKTPFISAVGAATAQFDGVESLGEFLTRYSPTKGAVGCIGATRGMALSGTYHERLLRYLFEDTISIAGELLWTYKLSDDTTSTRYKQRKYGYNLLGDPALNIFANPDSICRMAITQTETYPNPNGNTTLTVPCNCELHISQNGQLIIDNGGSLVIEDGARIIGDLCEESPVIHVMGDLSVGNNVQFRDLPGGIKLGPTAGSWTTPYYDDKRYDLENVTFYNTPVHHLSSRLNVNHCTFYYSTLSTYVSKSYINNSSFFVSNLMSYHGISPIMPNALKPVTHVTNCTFNGYGSNETAIDLANSTKYNIYNNVITGYAKGIVLSSSGETQAVIKGIDPGTPPHATSPDLIRSNTISNCGRGVEVYNSIAQFRSNTIFDNDFGVLLYNNSSTSFGSTAYSDTTTQVQTIHDNTFYQLYASSNSFPTVFRYNKMSKANNDHTPWIYYDEGPLPNPSLRRIDVTYNCWGDNFVETKDLYPIKKYLVNPTWCPTAKTSSLSPEEELFQTALDYFSEEEYTNAESTFKTLIATYPQSPFAVSALHELFALEQYLNNDYAALNGYYSTFTPNDTALFDVAAFLATRCHIQERNWQPAVDWYENRIENPPSYQDSVFAVIDLGNIHLLMEADTLGGSKGAHHCSYRLAQVKPRSQKEYEVNKSTLLATLPQIKKPQTANANLPTAQKGALGQNIPNPTKGTTTIGYEIFTEGTVEIRIHNSLGQQIKALPQGTLTAGKYQTTVSLTGVPAGMYYYALYVNGERTDAKKLVVN